MSPFARGYLAAKKEFIGLSREDNPFSTGSIEWNLYLDGVEAFQYDNMHK